MTTTSTRGQAFVAHTGAGTASAFREAFVEKTLAPMRALDVAASLRATTIAGTGTFGGQYSDYCEILSLSLAGKRIMMVYRDGTTDYLWLYGPDESTSAATWQSLGVAQIFGRIGVRMTWDASGVKASLSRDALTIASIMNAIDAAAIDAPPVVRVGIRCANATPDLEVVADDVEMYSPP